MEQVSAAYRCELQKRLIGEVECSVVLGLLDTSAAGDAAPTSADESRLSKCDGLFAASAPRTSYADAAPGRMRLDRALRVAPDKDEPFVTEGYCSDSICDAHGIFAAPPTLRIAFGARHTVPSLTFTFDEVCGEYPAACELLLYTGGELKERLTLAPDSAVWVLRRELTDFDGLELRFLRMGAPLRRARLQRLLFGEGLSFSGREIVSLTQKSTVDPAMRTLASGTAQLELVNRNLLTGTQECRYNADAPDGAWRFLDERSPVYISYTQHLTGGVTWGALAALPYTEMARKPHQAYTSGGKEQLRGGHYYLTARPTVRGNTAKFAASDVLSLLTDTYYKGVYAPQGESLYTLAQAVLEDAKLPRLSPNEPPWALWEGLRDLYTTAPLPVASHRECLQYIAHAARCVLTCLRDGRVSIAPAPQAATVLALPLQVQLNEPVVEKTEPLAAVCCTAQALLPKEQRAALHTGTYTVHGTLALHVEYAAATQIEAEAQGGAVQSMTAYARVADIVLAGEGEIKLTLTGYALAESGVQICVQNAKVVQSAVTEELKNPIITAQDNARAVAEHALQTLGERTVYTLKTAGNPELDALDILHADTLFSKMLPMRAVSCTHTYDGAMRSTITAKRGDTLADE